MELILLEKACGMIAITNKVLCGTKAFGEGGCVRVGSE